MIGFIIGFILGAWLGVVVACLTMWGGKDDN